MTSAHVSTNVHIHTKKQDMWTRRGGKKMWGSQGKGKSVCREPGWVSREHAGNKVRFWGWNKRLCSIIHTPSQTRKDRIPKKTHMHSHKHTHKHKHKYIHTYKLKHTTHTHTCTNICTHIHTHTYTVETFDKIVWGRCICERGDDIP